MGRRTSVDKFSASARACSTNDKTHKSAGTEEIKSRYRASLTASALERDRPRLRGRELGEGDRTVPRFMPFPSV